MSDSSSLWVDKYSPSAFSEFIGNSKVVLDLKKWAALWASGSKQKPVLLIGPPGCGKTTLVQLLSKSMNWQLMETNASNARSKANIESLIGGSQGMASFDGGQRLLLLDEVDGLGSGDRGGAAALSKVLRDFKSPMVLTANDAYVKSLRDVRGLTRVVKFSKVNYLSIAKKLREVCEVENVKYDRDALTELARRSDGDLRAALTDLQNISAGKSEIEMTDLDVIGYRDVAENVFKLLPAVFGSKNFDVVNRARSDVVFSVGIDTTMAWIEENLPRQYEYPYDLARAFPWLSKADIFLGRVSRRQYYGFWSFASILMTVGIAVSKVERYGGFKPYQYPGRFVTIARNRGARALDEGIAAQVGNACHVSINQAVKDYIPVLKILFKNKSFALPLAAQFEFNEKQVGYLMDKKETLKEVKELVAKSKELRGKAIGAKVSSGLTFVEPVIEPEPQSSLFSKREEKPEVVLESKQKSLFDFS